jgi:hypothetical protein
MSQIMKLIKYLPFLFLLMLTLNSCHTDEGKEAVGFFIGFVVFLIGTIVTGLPAIILSAVSISSKNSTVPILAIVFTVGYILFFMAQISIFTDSPADLESATMIFPTISGVIIVMCIIFIVIGFNKRKHGFTSKKDDNQSALDEILNDEDDNDLLK